MIYCFIYRQPGTGVENGVIVAIPIEHPNEPPHANIHHAVQGQAEESLADLVDVPANVSDHEVDVEKENE